MSNANLPSSDSEPCIGQVPVFPKPVWVVESASEATTHNPHGDEKAEVKHIISYNGTIYDHVNKKWVHTFTLSALARHAINTEGVSTPSEPPGEGRPVEPPIETLSTETQQGETQTVEPHTNHCDSNIIVNQQFGHFRDNQIVIDTDSDHATIRTEHVNDHKRFFTLYHFLDDDVITPCAVDDLDDKDSAGILEGLFEEDSSNDTDFEQNLNEFYEDLDKEDLEDLEDMGIDPSGDQSPTFAALNFAMGAGLLIGSRVHPAGAAASTAISIGQLFWDVWQFYEGYDEEDYTDADFSSRVDIESIYSPLVGHQITFDVVVDPLENENDKKETIDLSIVSNFGAKQPSFEEFGSEWELETMVHIERNSPLDFLSHEGLNYAQYHRDNQATPSTYDEALIAPGTSEPDPDLSISVPDHVGLYTPFEISGSISTENIIPWFYVWGLRANRKEVDCGIIPFGGPNKIPDLEDEFTDTADLEAPARVDLIVVDHTGIAWHKSEEFTVEPLAEIEGDTEIDAGKEVTWESAVQGENLSYDWGGDVNGSKPSVTKTFEVEGNYTIKLEVVAEGEHTVKDDTELEIEVQAVEDCPEPSAKISGPTEVNVNEEATWDANNSEGEGLNYTWGVAVDEIGPKVTEAFDSEGERWIWLEVEDDCGQTDIDNLMIEVIEPPSEPSAVINLQGSRPIEASEKVTWDADDSTGEGLNYRWRLDGRLLGTGSNVTETFSFNDVGEFFTLKLEVEDECDQTDTGTFQFEVVESS